MIIITNLPDRKKLIAKNAMMGKIAFSKINQATPVSFSGFCKYERAIEWKFGGSIFSFTFYSGEQFSACLRSQGERGGYPSPQMARPDTLLYFYTIYIFLVTRTQEIQRRCVHMLIFAR